MKWKNIIKELSREVMDIFTHPASLILFLAQNDVVAIPICDTDIWKTHLNKAEEIIKLNFHLRLQNTEILP